MYVSSSWSLSLKMCIYSYVAWVTYYFRYHLHFLCVQIVLIRWVRSCLVLYINDRIWIDVAFENSDIFTSFDSMPCIFWRSERPIVRDVFQGQHNGRPAIRIATWNLQELTKEKVCNPSKESFMPFFHNKGID